ncbi:uncharacterized protein [Porites lutea]|uniref:uncharacterized protein n=1 Tax=Porites lutea TaxID=51062 RepID=UPI003CC580BA
MPPIKKKKRTKVDRNFGEQEETESSESGKLSETNEVVKHLSRTRLDKENTPRRAKSWFAQRKEGDPYDADSEPEHGAIPLTAMTIDQNIPLDKQLFHSRLSPVHTDHSTPSIAAPNCGYQTSDCYGFDSMPSPLPFSPVGQPVLPPSFVPSSPGSVSVTSSITSISPGKRKADPRIFDVPIERPSKKMKKKKTKLLDTEDEDWVYELKAQFQEVEMVDLVID